jgi:hypothetical protein
MDGGRVTREGWITFCWIYGSVSVGVCLANLKDRNGSPWTLLVSGALGSAAILYFLGQMILEAGK